ncbi:MAG: DUF4364 family protein [Clostridia bacterium]|nr:DUF4364 family protein [Clostridia bacterium]
MGYLPKSSNIQKLLLLYITREFEYPLTEELFLKIIIDNEFMDYIEFKDCLNALLADKHIEKKLVAGLKAHKITEEGNSILNEFINKIPPSAISDLKDYFKNKFEEIKQKHTYESTYKILEDGRAEIFCAIREKDEMLLSMNVYVGDNASAKAICQNWETASPVMYRIIMDTLLR